MARQGLSTDLRFALKSGKIFSLILFTILSAETGLACASCGSGGDDPLILYPNEAWKLYLGLTRGFAYRQIDSSGCENDESGPTAKDQLTASVGRRLALHSFATVTVPYVVNRLHGTSKSGIGDPLLAFKYTVLPQTLVNEIIPQVQWSLSYRRGMSRSIYETRDPHRLDVFGSGFSQYRTGIDVWSGMTFIQYGFAHGIGFSPPRRTGDHEIAPGIEMRTTLTVGQVFSQSGKYALGVNRVHVSELKDNDELVADSDQLNYSFFVTGDIFLNEGAGVRGTLTKQAAILANKNTSRSYAATLAYMRSF